MFLTTDQSGSGNLVAGNTPGGCLVLPAPPSPYPTRGKNRAPAGLTGQNRLKEAKQLLGGRTPKENPGRGSGASPGWVGGKALEQARLAGGGGLTRAGCYRHKLFSAPGTLRRGSAPLTGRGGNPQQPHTDPTRTDSSSTKGVVCVCVCVPPPAQPHKSRPPAGAEPPPRLRIPLPARRCGGMRRCAALRDACSKGGARSGVRGGPRRCPLVY